MRTPIIVLCIASIAWIIGCAPAKNPYPTKDELGTLSEVRQLTTGFDRAGEAYFSPDGDWIVFQAVAPGEQHYQMYVAKLEYVWTDKGTGMMPVYATPLPGGMKIPEKTDRVKGLGRPIRISPENSRNTCGFFSPDGNSLIFSSTAGKEDASEPASGYQRQGGNYRWSFPAGMEIYRADNWLGAISAAEPGKLVDLAKHRLTENAHYDAECAYSPDGKFIIFTSDRSGEGDIYIMHSDGSNQTLVVGAKGYDGGPFFSPDGKRIVYRSDRKGDNNLQVFVADLVFDARGAITGTRNERQLTDDANVNWGPYWLPDGQRIIYASSAHGHENYELYLMRETGRRKTRITFSPGADVLPVMSPDGKYLMWSSKRTENRSTQIFITKFKPPKGS